MGRNEEFRDLFVDDYDRVVRTVFLIVRDQGRAEEIAQEAFLQLLRNWTRVSGHDRPEAWLRRVAIRMAVRSIKRDRTLARALLRVVPDQHSPPADADASADVLDAVATLPPQQRAAVVLFYYEDRPVEEVAQILDCSASTARVHLHKARKRLGALLSEEVPSDVR
jgi:RNA polymerase sigma-70 factor (sigma-E family)